MALRRVVEVVMSVHVGWLGGRGEGLGGSIVAEIQYFDRNIQAPVNMITEERRGVGGSVFQSPVVYESSVEIFTG
jgi:hypothetical protein